MICSRCEQADFPNKRDAVMIAIDQGAKYKYLCLECFAIMYGNTVHRPSPKLDRCDECGKPEPEELENRFYFQKQAWMSPDTQRISQPLCFCSTFCMLKHAGYQFI